MKLKSIQSKEFITASEVPDNVLVRKGDRVRLLRDREVFRVGYRLSRFDAPPMDADALELVRQLTLKATEGRLNRSPSSITRVMERWWGATWVMSKGMGGADRGVEIVSASYADYDALTDSFMVLSKCQRRVGTYFPPGGSGEDYEDGGLSNGRTIVVVTIANDLFDRFDVMSGDLELVEKAK